MLDEYEDSYKERHDEGQVYKRLSETESLLK